MADSLLVTGFAYDRRERIDNNYSEFCYFSHRTHGVRRGGAAALDLAFVAAVGWMATGNRDYSRDLRPVAEVEAAGGVVCDYDGSPVELSTGGWWPPIPLCRARCCMAWPSANRCRQRPTTLRSRLVHGIRRQSCRSDGPSARQWSPRPPTPRRGGQPLDCRATGRRLPALGLRRSTPPSLERIDTLEAGGAIQSHQVVQVVADEALGLRPEMTASIARAACTRHAAMRALTPALPRSTFKPNGGRPRSAHR